MTQPPAQPPYGGQPPWGGQPPYGEPQPYYAPPVKQGNGFAVAGIILAILAPLLGLIFSIIGLAKSGARAGAGKALSIVGIVLSLVVSAGGAVAIVKLAHSTAADPGCITAESDARQMGHTIVADGSAIQRDASNSSAVRTDLQKFLTDMQALRGRLSSAESQAQHQSVKTQISTLTSDISTFDSSLQAVANGDTSQASQMQTVANKIATDGNTLDSTCSSL